MKVSEFCYVSNISLNWKKASEINTADTTNRTAYTSLISYSSHSPQSLLVAPLILKNANSYNLAIGIFVYWHTIDIFFLF